MKILAGLTLIASIAFAQTDPTNLQVASITSTTAVLRWSGSNGDSFEIQMVPGSLIDKIQSTSYSISGLSPGTPYSWQLTAVKGNKRSQTVTGPSFTTLTPPPAPGGLTAVPTLTGAALSWGSVTGATSYNVQVSLDISFSNLKWSDSPISNSAIASGLSSATAYVWRVQAVGPTGSSGWTNGSFTTPVPVPQAPISLNQSPTSSGASLSWSGVTGATSYVVQVHADPAFGSLKWTNTVTSTSATATGLVGGTNYFWRVSSVNSGGQSGWTNSSFVTTLLSPSGLNSSPTSTGASLSWGTVSGATSYVVEVHDKSNYNSLVTTASPASNSTTISALQPGKTYYWQVKAVKGSVQSAWAQANFATTPPPSPPSVSVAPAITSVTITFNRVTGATSYDVKILDKQSNGSVVGSGSTNDATKPVTITGLKSKTKYYYEATVTVGGQTSDPAKDSFETDSGPVAPNPPTVRVSPASASADFTFSAVSGASSYDVKVYDKRNNGTVVGTGSTSDATKPVTISGLLSKTTYYYDATVTVNGLTSSPTSDSFDTQDGAPAPKQPDVRVNATLNSANFTFTAVTGATSYDVKLYDKQNNGTLIGSGSTNDATKPVTITGLQSKTKYYYNATVTVGGLTSAPTTDSFETLEGSAGPNPPAVQVSATTSSASFTFTGVSGATSYDVKLYDKQNNGALIGSGSTNDATKPVTITGLQSKTKYYYNATVTVGGQTSAPTSDSFETLEGSAGPNPPAVQISATTNSASFTFTVVTGATSYDVKVYDKQNNGTLIGSGSTNDATKPVTITGLQSKTKYYYDATVTVAGQTSAPTSDSFETLEGAAGPKPPEVKVSATSSDASFTFTAVTGATSYDVKVYDKQNNGTLIGSGSTNDATKPVTITGLKSKTKYYYDATVTVGGQTSTPTSDSFETTDGTGGVSGPEVSVTTSSSAATFTFKDVKDATLYKVLIYDKEPHGNSKAGPIDSGSTDAATKPVVISGLKSKTQYYYSATVTVGKVESDPTPGDFTTSEDSSGTLAAPSNLQVSIITSVSASLSWDGPNQGGAKFELKVSPGNIGDANAKSPYDLKSLSPKTTYNWQVRTLSGKDSSAWVSGPAFTTLDSAVGTLVAPTNPKVTDITSVSASLSWDGPGQGAKYELKASPGNFRDANANSPYGLSSLSPKTAYTWQVRTVKNNDSSAWVAGPSFTTLDVSAGTLVAPSNLKVSGVTSTSALLSWDGTDQGTKFDLKLSPGNFLYSNLNSSPQTVSQLSPNTTYSWLVRSVKTNDSSGWVQGSSFTTSPSTTSLPTPPSPTVPPDGASNLSRTVSFSWGPHPNAASFHLQVSKNSSFSPLVLDMTNISTLSVSAELDVNTTYYWRVSAANASGEGAFSSVRTFTVTGTTAVEPVNNGIATEFALSQNYPNPFNPTTTIQFSLPSSSNVRITIYNTLGNLVHLLVNGHYTPGRYTATWDASSLPSGVYFYRLQTDTFVDTKRLVLLK